MLKYWNSPVFKDLKQNFSKDFLDIVFSLINYFPSGDSIEKLLEHNDITALFTIILDWMIILILFSDKNPE